MCIQIKKMQNFELTPKPWIKKATNARKIIFRPKCAEKWILNKVFGKKIFQVHFLSITSTDCGICKKVCVFIPCEEQKTKKIWSH
jgi:hypothetical protein